MKTIVIVYAISWLILLFVYIISLFQNKKSKKKDDAFEKFLNKHKSTKEKILDKLVYVIMIVFAPLVVFVIPYILIRNMKTKKQARIREEERERSERDEKEHIAVCTTNYSALVSEKQNQCGDDYIRIAKSLKKLVDKKSYQEIINFFDKTSLPAAMKLGVRECEHKGAGSVSRLVIETAENVREDNILNNLKFEDSPMGAWQAYLLCQMWHISNSKTHQWEHGRHTCYAKCGIICPYGGMPTMTSETIFTPVRTFLILLILSTEDSMRMSSKILM